MIFYFTATGNSLYVAKRICDNPISIAQVKNENTFKDNEIGIVCPIYCGEIPKLVFDFIKRSNFDTEYLYLILTYGMSESDCPEFTHNQCKAVGKNFDYIGIVKMVDNYLPAFDMNVEKSIDKQVEPQIERIKLDISTRKSYVPIATDEGRKLHKRVAKLNKAFPSMNNGSLLKIGDKCTGCGVCKDVCPMGNVTILNAKAIRINKTCEFCLACIHHCPSNAISLKTEKNSSARYINEHILLDEIIKSNQQEKQI